MSPDCCATEFEDEDVAEDTESQREDDRPCCNRHTNVLLDAHGKCCECELLRGRNMKFTKGKLR